MIVNSLYPLTQRKSIPLSSYHTDRKILDCVHNIAISSISFNYISFYDKPICNSVQIKIKKLRVKKDSTEFDKGKGIRLTSRYLWNIHQILTFILARIARNVAATVNPTLDLFTRYPLLLANQLQCGLKDFPRLLHGVEPQDVRSRAQRLIWSATRSWWRYLYISLDICSCSSNHYADTYRALHEAY